MRLLEFVSMLELNYTMASFSATEVRENVESLNQNKASIKAMLSQQGAENIMITCPCNVYPLTSHFYIVKLGFTGVYIFSYFCSKT